MRLNFDLMTGYSRVPLQLFTVAGHDHFRCYRAFFVVLLVLRRSDRRSGSRRPVHAVRHHLLPGGHCAVCRLGLLGEYVGRIYQQVRRGRATWCRPCWRAAAEPAPVRNMRALIRSRQRAETGPRPRCARRVCLSQRRRALPVGAAGARCRGATGADAIAMTRRRTSGLTASRSWQPRIDCPASRRTIRTRRDKWRIAQRCNRISCSRSTTATCSSRTCWPGARGAYNMHGSLLPKYPRSCAGELGHHSWANAKPVPRCIRWWPNPTRALIAAQQAVPILPDDTAFDVFQKVTVAAELALYRCCPAFLTAR